MTGEPYILLGIAMFFLGALVVIVRRNAIVAFMGIEIMLNAVNLLFVTFSKVHAALDGQVVVFFVMAIAAAEAAIGLAIILSLFRSQASARIDEATTLGG